MRAYIIRQGEWLDKIAHRFGFSAEDVWSHPANEPLRQTRGTPNILQPGDILQIPEARDCRRPLPLEARGENLFRARIPEAKLKLTFEHEDGTPIANERFRVEIPCANPISGETDGQGIATLSVPVSAPSVTLHLPGISLEYRLRVGGMDPATEALGIAKRLANLGFLALPENSEFDVKEEMLQSALFAFQEAESLPRSGIVDEQTRQALLRAHGS